MNLYVSNLGDQITEESLRAVFATYGNVSTATVIRDEMSGERKGFAFIEMPNDVEAIRAMEKINGSVLNGRTVSVQQARPGSSRPSLSPEQMPFGH